MSGNGTRWKAVLDCNETLRDQMLTWILLLYQLNNEKYRSDARLITIIQFVHQLITRELARALSIEEERLYADTEDLPGLRGLVRQLREEHEELHKCMESVDRNLREAAAPEHADAVRKAGLQLVQALGVHMQRVEQECVPLIEARYRMLSPESAALRECA